MFSGHGSEGFGDCVDPRQQFVDFAVEVTVDDFAEDLGQIGVGSTPLSLEASTKEAITGRFSPPP